MCFTLKSEKKELERNIAKLEAKLEKVNAKIAKKEAKKEARKAKKAGGVYVPTADIKEQIEQPKSEETFVNVAQPIAPVAEETFAEEPAAQTEVVVPAENPVQTNTTLEPSLEEQFAAIKEQLAAEAAAKQQVSKIEDYEDDYDDYEDGDDEEFDEADEFVAINDEVEPLQEEVEEVEEIPEVVSSRERIEDSYVRPVVQEEPKRRPGRPKKVVTETAPVATEPTRRPGRPKKVVVEESAEPVRRPGRPRKVEPAVVAEEPKRRPGRPKKVVTETAPVATEPARRPGRPKKAENAPKAPASGLSKYEVFYDEDRAKWVIRKEGAGRLIASYDLKEEAVDRVIELANNSGATFSVPKND